MTLVLLTTTLPILEPQSDELLRHIVDVGPIIFLFSSCSRCCSHRLIIFCLLDWHSICLFLYLVHLGAFISHFNVWCFTFFDWYINLGFVIGPNT